MVTGTFAQRYWKDFERLAFDLTAACFGVTPTKVFRTQDSKDGGFDSVFLHDIGKLGNAVISYETLMEAKLRTERDSVGLRAFAATMIIAFNGHTQCLVIVTNRDFSPQALEAARDFAWKSRLKVLLVSGRTLSAWVRPRIEELGKRYPSELLYDVLLPHPDEELLQEVLIPAGAMDLEPPARISFGRLPDGSFANGEIAFSGTAAESPQEGRIIGRTRERLVMDLTGALDMEAGCAVLQGERGIGKSAIAKAVIRGLRSDRRCIGILDLAQIATARHLFLSVLACLSGVGIAEAARQLRPASRIQLFSSIGGVPIPEKIRDAVAEILAAGSKEFTGHADTDQVHLIEYLSIVAASRRASARLLVVEGVSVASSDVLEFLHAIVPTLVACNVSMLVELSIAAVPQDIEQEQWQAHVSLFERSATLGRFTVTQFDVDEAVHFLLERLPGLGEERAQFVVAHVGCQPLFLHHAALWLKRHRVVTERAPGVHLVENPEAFFEGLRPEACLAILDRHIDLWRREIELPFADAITTASLLRGRVPTTALNSLIPPTMRPEAFLDALVATGLFVAEPRLQGARVANPLILERMMAIEQGSVPGFYPRAFDRKRVAASLLSNVPSFSSDEPIRDLYSSTLHFACGQWELAFHCASRAGRHMVEQYQLTLASEAFAIAVLAAEELGSENPSLASTSWLQSMVELLEVEDSRYRLGTELNQYRLQALASRIGPSPETEPTATMTELTLRAGYVQWRSAFTRERFDQALSIAQRIRQEADTHPSVDPDVAGHTVAALGITLKAVERIAESTRVFDIGVSRYPTSAWCRMTRWSNLAALALRTDPIVALSYYQRILGTSGDPMPLLDRLHSEVDLAMALFLAGDPKGAAVQAMSALRSADANGVPAESARSRNILGCSEWCFGDLGRALALFDRAVLDAERSYMGRFAWRFRVNLASAKREAGEIFDALANARWAEDRIVASRVSRWAQSFESATSVTSRWYVALLAIGHIYDQCDSTTDTSRLLLSVSLPHFRRHLEMIRAGTFPEEVFGGTTHLQGSRIVITG